MLLRHHKAPEMFSSILCNFFVNFMPFIALIWSLYFAFFIDNMSAFLDAGDDEELNTKRIITSNSLWMSNLTIILAGICVLLPIRTLQNKLQGDLESKALQD